MSGFIFGKPKVTNKDNKKGGEWSEGHDDYSLLIRSVNGTVIPMETVPTPEFYEAIKKSAEKLLKSIEDEELEKRIDSDTFRGVDVALVGGGAPVEFDTGGLVSVPLFDCA